MKLVTILALATAIAAGYTLLEKVAEPTDVEIADQVKLRSPDIVADNGAAPVPDIANKSSVVANRSEQVAIGNETPVHGNDIDGPKWPEGIENLIFDYFAQLEGFEFASINSVNCEPQTCEIVFSGTNPNPAFVDDYSDVLGGLYRPPVNAQQGSIGTREIAAGAREFVIRISNAPYVEPSDNQ